MVKQAQTFIKSHHMSFKYTFQDILTRLTTIDQKFNPMLTKNLIVSLRQNQAYIKDNQIPFEITTHGPRSQLRWAKYHKIIKKKIIKKRPNTWLFLQKCYKVFIVIWLQSNYGQNMYDWHKRYVIGKVSRQASIWQAPP